MTTQTANTRPAGSRRKAYAYLGILGVVLAFSAIATSIFLSPWFSWYGNDLSDLGNTSMARNTSTGVAWIFDLGLLLSGVLIASFALLISKSSGFSWKYLVWSVPLTLASIDLCLIGIFNESFGAIHLLVSVAFFFLTALTLFLYSYVSFPLGMPRTGAVSLAMGVICSAMWVARWPWQGVAIQETVTSLASSLLVIMIAIRLLNE